METYTFLRHAADSWGLMAMFIFFIGVVLFVYRPGASKVYRDVAAIPLRHEDKPAARNGAESKEA